jgi:hypothetical protein
VQNQVWCWGWDVGTFSLLFRFCIDYWLFAHVKEILGVNDLNQMMHGSSVNASLHCLCKDEYRDAIDHLTHRW